MKRRSADLLDRFLEFVSRNRLFTAGDRLLLAVSGGLDSVVLTHLCQKAGYEFALAHCNFQLRGKESKRDEKFVKKLAAKYNAEFFLERFDTKQFSTSKKISVQEAARVLRYEWFQSILKEKDFSFLLTAHHGDDNVETILFNLFRGTGLKGLKGMEARSGKIVRPLLFTNRKDLAKYAAKNKLKFVEDSSNISDDYSRNQIRNKIIPAIEKYFPSASKNIGDSIQRLHGAYELYEQGVERHLSKLIEKRGDEFFISVLKLKKSSPLSILIHEIASRFGFTPDQGAEIESLLDSPSGRYIKSGTHRILKDRAWLIISSFQAIDAGIIVIDESDQNEIIRTSDFSLRMQSLNGQSSKQELLATSNKDIALLDASAVEFPLLLRRWKQGDYFYPLGMMKKKKLARFFIDQKLSITEKERTWVVEGNKKILWVVGHRIDERFKVTDKTRKILKLSMIKL